MSGVGDVNNNEIIRLVGGASRPKVTPPTISPSTSSPSFGTPPNSKDFFTENSSTIEHGLKLNNTSQGPHVLLANLNLRFDDEDIFSEKNDHLQKSLSPDRPVDIPKEQYADLFALGPKFISETEEIASNQRALVAEVEDRVGDFDPEK